VLSGFGWFSKGYFLPLEVVLFQPLEISWLRKGLNAPKQQQVTSQKHFSSGQMWN
jgi:hypothetical protein